MKPLETADPQIPDRCARCGSKWLEGETSTYTVYGTVVHENNRQCFAGLDRRLRDLEEQETKQEGASEC